jgi:hypothetical protein
MLWFAVLMTAIDPSQLVTKTACCCSTMRGPPSGRRARGQRVPDEPLADLLRGVEVDRARID